MKAIAQRLKTLKPSPTLSVSALAGELKKQGKDVVNFGAGEPDFDTPANIKAAAQRAIERGETKYTPVSGTTELKDAVILKLKRDNQLSYTREEILISNGAKHSLFNIMMALVENGDEVIIPAPYWVSYPELVLIFGGRPVIVTTTDDNQFKMTAGLLRKAISKKTVAVIINSPSNPTGMGYTRDELSELAAVCVQNGTYIIADEIYEHIVYDGFAHVSVAAIAPATKDITFTVNGASKCYAMTGWRMGFCAGPKGIIAAMETAQSQSTSNVCSITQAACVEAFAASQDAVKKMVLAFRERRDCLIKDLSDIKELACVRPTGAFYAFPNIASLFGKKTPDGNMIRNSQDFCLYLLQDQLVACVPGSAFGAEGFARLSYATDLASIKEGVRRIAKAVAQLT